MYDIAYPLKKAHTSQKNHFAIYSSIRSVISASCSIFLSLVIRNVTLLHSMSICDYKSGVEFVER